MKEELLAPDAIVEVQHLVREISSSAASDKAKRKQTIAARLLELDREIGNLVPSDRHGRHSADAVTHETDADKSDALYRHVSRPVDVRF